MIRWHVYRIGRRVYVRKGKCKTPSFLCALAGGAHFHTHAAALSFAIGRAHSIPPRVQEDYVLAQGGAL